VGPLLDNGGVLQLQVWRLVTFQFLHGSLLHIAFNMVGLWMMGRPVEEPWRRKYLAFYSCAASAAG
jgi:membrane associated rhomboid family serine protease